MDLIPPAVASNSVHLAAMNTGFKSDVGLAVTMHPPIDWVKKLDKWKVNGKLASLYLLK